MTVSTPVLAWIASLLGSATGVNQSSSLTATVNITSAWEVQVPIKIQYSAVSADATVSAYPSNDGGANYDSNPAYSISLIRATGATKQASIRLPAGQWALQLLNSGPNSATFQVLTAQVVTAVNNV